MPDFSKLEKDKVELSKKTPYQLAELYYGGKIPSGVTKTKDELIRGILEDRFGPVAEQYYKTHSSLKIEAEDWLKEAKKEREKNPLPKSEQIPEGLFTEPARNVADGLLKVSKNDIGKAIRKLTFYMNRAGDNLTNKTELEKAKDILQKKNEKKKEQSSLETVAETIDLTKNEVEDPVDSLKFYSISKSDKGWQDIDYYFTNEFVDNQEIKKNFYNYVKSKFGNINILKNEVSTSKLSDFNIAIESFIEDIFGRPFYVYFGDGMWGIWVAEIPFGKKTICFLQLEEPKTPASRLFCVREKYDINILNKLLADWKASKEY